MKYFKIYFFALMCLIISSSYAQKPNQTKAKPIGDASAKPKFNFETAQNDPYKARIYTFMPLLKV